MVDLVDFVTFGSFTSLLLLICFCKRTYKRDKEGKRERAVKRKKKEKDKLLFFFNLLKNKYI